MFIGLNAWLADWANKRYDYYWYWFLALCFLPIISHVFLLCLPMYLRSKKQTVTGINPVSGKADRDLDLLKDRIIFNKKTDSVTPFDDAGQEVDTNIESDN